MPGPFSSIRFVTRLSRTMRTTIKTQNPAKSAGSCEGFNNTQTN